MRKVGKFLHRIGKSLVLKAEDPRELPRIGAPLFDEKGRKVAIVADIIGNVKSPYLVARGSVVEMYYTKEKFLLRGEIHG